MAPINDAFDDAKTLIGESFSINGSNEAAVGALNEPLVHPSASGRSVWYKWDAPRSGQVYLNIVGDQRRMLTRAFSGNSLETLEDVSTSLSSADLGDVVFNAIEGVQYSIAVDSVSESGGGFRLDGGFFDEPIILRQPTDQSVEEGREAVFNISVFGAGTPVFQWYFNEVLMNGETGSKLRIANAGESDVGDYHVEIELGGETLRSRTAKLELGAGFTQFLVQPANQSVFAGDDIELRGLVTSPNTLSYQWYRDREAIPGATDPAYTIEVAAVSDSGFYRLVADDGTRAYDSALAYADVSSNPDWKGIVNPILGQSPRYWSKTRTDGDYLVSSGEDGIAFSLDGLFWQYGVIEDSREFSGFAQGNGVYVVSTEEGYFVSENLLNWEPTSITDGSNYGVAFLEGIFLAAAGDDLLRSVDGVNWTSVPFPGADQFFGISYADGSFLLFTSDKISIS